jgi:hypothetical protein
MVLLEGRLHKGFRQRPKECSSNACSRWNQTKSLDIKNAARFF